MRTSTDNLPCQNNGNTDPIVMNKTMTLAPDALLTHAISAYATPHRMAQQGDTLSGRYELQDVLGSGTYGRVFRAWDRVREQVVAIKVLHTYHPVALRRFKNEFRALRELRHPNLVRVYNLGRDADTWFLVMEYVDGVYFIMDECVHEFKTEDKERDVEPTIQWGTDARRPFESVSVNRQSKGAFDGEAPGPLLPADSIQHRLGQLASAMLALHTHDIVHCDLKPSNILVTKSGRVVLLDFGVSRYMTHVAFNYRDTGTHTGTRPYLAPELGDSHSATPALDWYALGIILGELLTGLAPDVFARASHDTRTAFFARLSERQPEYAALATLCLQLTDTDPTERGNHDSVFHICYGHDANELERHISGYLPFYNARPDDLARLERLYDSFTKGRPTTAIIEAQPHMGTDTLCQIFLRRVTQTSPNARILVAQCRSDELLGYRAFDEIMDGISAIISSLPSEAQQQFLPYCAPSLCALFPALRAVQPQPKATYLDDPLIALRSLLVQISKRYPLVLVVKDIHCADLGSLRWISRLFSPGTGPNVFLLLTRRPDGAMTNDLIDTKTLSHAIPRIGLAPLSPAAAKDVVRAWIPNEFKDNEGLMDTIVRVADGRIGTIRIICSRPEMLQYLTQDTSLHGLIKQILEMLSPAHLAILYATATSFGAISAERLGYVTQQKAVELNANIGFLTNLYIIEEADTVDDAHYKIIDPRIRTIIEQYTPKNVLQDYHYRHARSGTVQHLPPLTPTTLVQHLILADRWENAQEIALKLAEKYADEQSFELAVELFNQYFEICEHLGVTPAESTYIRSLQAQSRAGKFEKAGDILIKLATQSVGENEVALRLKAAEYYYLAGEKSKAKAQIGRVNHKSLHVHHERLPRVVKSHTAPILARLVYTTLRTERRIERMNIADYSNAPLNPTTGALLSTYNITGLELSMTNGFRATELAIKKLNLAMDLRRNGAAAKALGTYISYISSGSYTQQRKARRYLALATQLAERSHDPLTRQWIDVHRAAADYHTGHFQRAWSQLTASHQWILERAPEQRMMLSYVRIYLVLCSIISGKTEELRFLYYDLVADARARHNPMSESSIVLTGFVTWLFDDAPSAARTAIGQLTQPVEPGRFQLHDLLLTRNYAELALYEQKSESYHEHTKSLLAFTDSFLLKGLIAARYETYNTISRLLWAQEAASPHAHFPHHERLMQWGNLMTQRRNPLTIGWGHQIIAGTHYLAGERDACIRHLERAVKIQQAHGLHLFAELSIAAIQHIDNHGQPFWERLYGLGIVAPERLLYAYHPYLLRSVKD